MLLKYATSTTTTKTATVAALEELSIVAQQWFLTGEQGGVKPAPSPRRISICAIAVNHLTKGGARIWILLLSQINYLKKNFFFQVLNNRPS